MYLRYTKQPRQNRLLRMQAIVRLWEDHRMRTIRHIIGQFVVAMRRQTVHDDHILIRFTHQLRIDLIGWEDFLAPGSFFFLAHAMSRYRCKSHARL